MRFIVFTLLLFGFLSVSAQISGVVVDMETKKPLPYVKIKTDNGHFYATDYKGCFRIKDEFKSVSFSNFSYLKREMNRSEVGDTIFLLPYILNDFVVYGTNLKKPHFTFKSVGKANPITGVSKPSGMDFLGWLNVFDRSRHHPSKKERQKNKEILDNY